MADVTPINAPSQAELWRRNQLALSILNQRTILPASTAELLRRVLRGEEPVTETSHKEPAS